MSYNAGGITEKQNSFPEEILPLTAGQKFHRLLNSHHPDSTAYNLSELIELKADVDVERLKNAVSRVVLHHPVFCVRLVKTPDERYGQIFDPSLYHEIPVIDLSEEEFEELKTHMVRPMDLYQGGLYRFAIYRTPLSKYLFLDMHHFISDSSTCLLIRNQIADCYENENAVLPEDHYLQYLDSLKGFKDEFAKDRCISPDRNAVDCSCILKADLPGPDTESDMCVYKNIYDRQGGYKGIQFITAAAMAAARLNQESSVLIYTAYHGRNVETKKDMAAMMACCIPVFLQIGKNDSPSDLVYKVKQQLAYGKEHCNEFLMDTKNINLANTVVFNYQNGITEIGRISKYCVGKDINFNLFNREAKEIFTAGIIEKNNEDPVFYCCYPTGFYSREFIDDYVKEFKKTLEWLKDANG